MKRLISAFLIAAPFAVIAQDGRTRTASVATPSPAVAMTVEKLNPSTSVKNQQNTGTCWCFSGTSLLEAQALKATGKPIDLSEMFTVRNIYFEKARNYFLRQGHAQFGEGGLGHDVIRAVATYGAMPESAFTGLPADRKVLDHQQMVNEMKSYLDSSIARAMRGDAEGAKWQLGVNKLLSTYLGTPPSEFQYEGKTYTPKTFAKEVLKFNADDYVSITSFTDHPYYTSFMLSVPDNFSNGYFYNLPLQDMIDATKIAVRAGYTVSWDADVSNNGFSQQKGEALFIAPAAKLDGADSSFNQSEQPYNADIRQQLFENLTTQDDHLMHIIGLEKNREGKSFFIVKNSWGPMGKYNGYLNVSEPYFAINTISIVLPKAGLTKALMDKMGIK